MSVFFFSLRSFLYQLGRLELLSRWCLEAAAQPGRAAEQQPPLLNAQRLQPDTKRLYAAVRKGSGWPKKTLIWSLVINICHVFKGVCGVNMVKAAFFFHDVEQNYCFFIIKSLQLLGQHQKIQAELSQGHSIHWLIHDTDSLCLWKAKPWALIIFSCWVKFRFFSKTTSEPLIPWNLSSHFRAKISDYLWAEICCLKEK